MATRRAFLERLAIGLGVLACRGAVAQPADGALYAGIETSAATGLSRANFFAGSGRSTGTVTLDFRAHGMVQAGETLAIFPRRPGNRIALVDTGTLDIRAVVTAPVTCHFYGHGAVTQDGAHLLVAENDLNTLQGGIGIYEITGAPRRLGAVALPGAGPHEVIRLPGGDTFLIALGGLETHPAYGRAPLNLGTFQSQILVLDLPRGEITEAGVWAGTEGISLRHLARDGRGRIVVGGQVVDQRRGTGHVLWSMEGSAAQPLEAGRELGGYVSSVAAHGNEVLVTSKTAHLGLLLTHGRVTRRIAREGASAAALGPAGLALSGYGQLTIAAQDGGIVRVPSARDGARADAPFMEFDNHGLMLRLT